MNNRGDSLLADALVSAGVEVVFAVLGDGNMFTIDELAKRGVNIVRTRHEAGAVSMADGYARATGRAAVASVTHGPGLTQIGTAIVTARRASSPVVVLAGDTDPRARLHGQNFDQSPFSLATAGHTVRVRSVDTIEEDVALAFRHVGSGRGPTVLEVDTATQLSEREAPFAPQPSAAVHPGTQRGEHPDGEILARVIALLDDCARPVLLAGRGAIHSGARVEMLELARRLGAPVATTLLARGWFDGEAEDLGLCGGFADGATARVLDEADLLLSVGASLNRFTVAGGRFIRDRSVISIDPAPTAVGDPTVPTELLLADGRSSLRALLAQLPRQQRGRWWSAAERSQAPTVVDVYPDGMDPRGVLAAIDRRIGGAGSVVVGIGHYSGWGAMGLTPSSPEQLVLPWEFGAVGVALGTGLGVAVARAPEPVVIIEGDGGILMSLPELDTLARLGLPTLVVVLDDEAYAAEVHLLERHGRKADLARFATPELAVIAEGIGIRSRSARDAGQLELALDDLLPLDGPRLLHVKITTSIVHDEIFAALGAD